MKISTIEKIVKKRLFEECDYWDLICEFHSYEKRKVNIGQLFVLVGDEIYTDIPDGLCCSDNLRNYSKFFYESGQCFVVGISKYMTVLVGEPTDAGLHSRYIAFTVTRFAKILYKSNLYYVAIG